MLVMTSGNLSEEPIVKDNDEAVERLSPLADALLLHDREIHIHCDDSVIRVLDNEVLPVRRGTRLCTLPGKAAVQNPTCVGGGWRTEEYFLPNAAGIRVHEPAHWRHGEFGNAASV